MRITEEDKNTIEELVRFAEEHWAAFMRSVEERGGDADEMESNFADLEKNFTNNQ